MPRRFSEANSRVLVASVAVLIWGTVASAGVRDGASGGPPVFDLTVELSTSEPLGLEFRLTLRSSTPALVARAALPWENEHSLVLLAARPNGRPVDRVMTIGDPGFDTLQLEPNRPIEGSLPMDRRFHGLEGVLQSTEVILFWSYRLEPVYGPPGERVGGWLVIPRRGKAGEAGRGGTQNRP